MSRKQTRKTKSKTILKKSRLRDKNLFIENQKEFFEDVPQHLLGISDQQLGRLFENAWAYAEIHEAVPAIKGFRLLCSLHPFVSDFWYGLAHSLRESGVYDEAKDAYLMAETLEPERYVYYLENIECCLEMGDKKGAKRIFHRLLSHRRIIDEFASKRREIMQLKKLVE
jgi:tetratricopeptide (TPR) repeat protein